MVIQWNVIFLNIIFITLAFVGLFPVKWRVSKGTMVSAGRVLLLYNCNSPDGNSPEKKLRATQVGRVTKLAVKNGDVVQPG